MADFVLSIATVKTAFDTFRTAQAASNTAKAAIVSLGAAPSRPVDVAADTDWNSYVTSLNTYNSTLAGLVTTANTTANTQRTAELAVIAAMGYGTGDTPDSICLDQWLHVVGSGGGVLTYSLYIGASINSTYLTILSSAPTQAYPLF